MTREQEIAFARRWIADHTDEHHHEGGDRVLALLDALLAERERLERKQYEAWDEGAKYARARADAGEVFVTSAANPYRSKP